ncbi:MAG: heme-binding protein [Candidatus Dormibacteraeota bacterium]|nr:heme-binding protein [Candidatus Dormibacteraeota bacterium]
MPCSQKDAETVVAAAHAKARELGIQVTVAVVDEGGLLQVLSRMDGTPPISAQIAEAKAAGAALWHREGDSLAQVQQQRPAFFTQVDRLARLPIMPGEGSLLMRRGDAILGAVGVSGGAPAQDRECAQAGIDKL